MADGSNRWAVEQKVIGSGWQGFNRVFSGDNGAIYVIQPDGRLMFYRFAGMRRRQQMGGRAEADRDGLDVHAGHCRRFRQSRGDTTGAIAAGDDASPAPAAATSADREEQFNVCTLCQYRRSRLQAGHGSSGMREEDQGDHSGRWIDDFNRHTVVHDGSKSLADVEKPRVTSFSELSRQEKV
jgi:hypothetical protein